MDVANDVERTVLTLQVVPKRLRVTVTEAASSELASTNTWRKPSRV
jgi:hypothetical protein